MCQAIGSTRGSVPALLHRSLWKAFLQDSLGYNCLSTWLGSSGQASPSASIRDLIYFFIKKFYLLTALGRRCCEQAPSWVSGATLCCGGQASHCSASLAAELRL